MLGKHRIVVEDKPGKVAGALAWDKGVARGKMDIPGISSLADVVLGRVGIRGYLFLRVQSLSQGQ